MQSRVTLHSDSDDSDDLSHLGAAAVPSTGEHVASVHSYGSNDPTAQPTSTVPAPKPETQRPGKRKRGSGGSNQGENSRSQRSERRRARRSNTSRRHGANGRYREMTNEDDNGNNADEPIVVTVKNASSRSRRGDIGGSTSGHFPPRQNTNTQELSEAVYLGDESDDEPAAVVAPSRYNEALSRDVERAVEVQISASSEDKTIKLGDDVVKDPHI